MNKNRIVVRILTLSLAAGILLVVPSGCSPENDLKSESFSDTQSIQEESSQSSMEKVSEDQSSQEEPEVDRFGRPIKVLLGVVVNRREVNLKYADEGDVKNTDNIYSYSLDYLSNVLEDIDRIRWIAPRTWRGEYVDISELPIIQKSNFFATFQGFEFDGTLMDDSPMVNGALSVKDVWIRLIYEPYIVDPSDGVGHKDIILYQDPENHEDAILAKQDAEDPTVWYLIPLPGYGQWLEREIDMVLRGTGF